jgi:hypothetical protein
LWYDRRKHKPKTNMKKTAAHTKRSRAAASARKAATRRKRPLHKRVLLHPLSVMILLCAGVLVIGSTFQSRAASYDVTATVPAPIPGDPAVIQQPADQAHFTSGPITVGGTCSPQSYVKLYRNGVFSGVSACDANLLFSVQTDLSDGPNELVARIFNFTDQEGPGSSPITVYYALPVPPPAAPEELQISSVERGDGTIRQVSASPTITGLAPPFSDITVTFHSVVSTCKTKADARGVWSCTLANELEVGTHQVDIVAVTTDGRTLVFPTFRVQVVAGRATVKQNQPALVLASDYQYKVHKAGEVFRWEVGVNGGVPPYHVTVDWGDGSQQEMTHPDQSVLQIAHNYAAPKDYAILVTVTDSKGATATLQWVAVVKDSIAYAAYLSTHRGTFASLLAGIRQWLWVVWPVYIAVVLMVLSYWIGEREGYRRIMLNRRQAAGRGRGR